MKTILNVKRTVSQYVWFNIGIFVAYLIVSLYGNLNYGASSEQIKVAASQAGNETLFWVMLFGMVLVAITIVLILIWFFYKLLYGILLKRLRKNYNELKKLEV
jgi:heme/copper-type cytochrome/quinol oxidase subunit 2